jgi:hypothetical protein
LWPTKSARKSVTVEGRYPENYRESLTMPRADKLSPGAVKLLEEPQTAILVTLMPDGSPQVTPVWVDIEPDGAEAVIPTSGARRDLGRG